MANTSSYYKAKRAANLTNPTSASVFVQNDSSTKAAYVRIQGETGDTNKRYFISARGRATTGGSLTFTAKVQFSTNILTTASASTAITAGNNTDVFALTARTLATVTRPWFIDLELVWDSTSQRLSGQSNGYNGETIETANASITALTGVDLTTGKCGFVVAATFGSSNSSNVATLDDFYIEVM